MLFKRMENGMKCVQFPNGKIVRVPDTAAQTLISRYTEVRYVSKEAWKQQGRSYQLNATV